MGSRPTFFTLLLGISQGLAYTKLDLGDLQWTVMSNSRPIEAPASVPGGIYTDLMNAGYLTDGPFYYRDNDDKYRWVAYDNWTYSATIFIDSDFLNHDVLILECEGLDTAAGIMINGQEVGHADNMFRRYTFDVSSALVLGPNQISVNFESPISYSSRMFDEQKNNFYIVPPECTDPQFQGECHANHIRKMQASFSWDWGPAFPSMGIWQPISMEAYSCSAIKYVKWNAARGSANYDVTLDVILDIDPNDIVFNGVVEVNFLGETRRFDQVVINSAENPREAITSVQFTVPVNLVEEWWPNETPGGLGPILYDLSVSFLCGNDITTKSMKVGFRTVELIQEPLLQGLSYKFRINGREMFMKGSNWIPAHVLPEQVTREYIFDLLMSAKEAHMNMMRVWGGGIYEADAFYEIADELGILIWQDHMFACSMYQANPDNLINADLESKHQIRRLQHHPSIAVWAGNNENEKALRQNWYGTQSNFEVYKSDYIKLYVDTMMRRAQLEDPTRPFLISSPNNGDLSIEEGYIALNPGDPLYGDKHFYDYSRDNWNYTIYPNTRFGSEYGFQSFPSFEIIQTVSEPEDWSFYSEFTNHRQRHPNGMNELQAQISTKMDLPVNELGTENGFREFLYLSQVYQAVSLKTETEFYRRHMTEIDPNTGEGQCMGALYWQLNDVWPGASWTSIEHGGRKWRMSHYFAEKMFRQVIISPFYNELDNTFEVYLISDNFEDLANLTLTISVKSIDASTSDDSTFNVGSHPSQTARSIANVDMDQLLANCDSINHCYITVRLFSNNSEVIADNYWTPYPINMIGLPVPNIQLASVIRDNSCASSRYPVCFNIDLLSDASLALYVWLEALGIDGHFDDNGFLMEEPNKSLKFFCKDQDVTESQFSSSLQVRSYKNSYVNAQKVAVQ